MEFLRVGLDPAEYRALVRLAERELRPLPDQARAVLREALRRRGLLRQPGLAQQREADDEAQ